MDKGKKLRSDEVVVDMNDIKGMFREWMMMKIDENLEDMIKSYFNKEMIGDNIESK